MESDENLNDYAEAQQSYQQALSSNLAPEDEEAIARVCFFTSVSFLADGARIPQGYVHWGLFGLWQGWECCRELFV